MNKLLMSLAVATALLTGCTSTPTPESTQAQAYTAGQLAAYVASTSPKFTPQVKDATIVVLTKLSKVAPAEGQTLTQAWAPVIAETADELVAQGKLKPADRNAVIAVGGGMTLAADAFLAKNPKLKESVELTAVAVQAFSLGALTFICPEGTCSPTTDPAELESMKATFKSQGL